MSWGAAAEGAGGAAEGAGSAASSAGSAGSSLGSATSNVGSAASPAAEGAGAAGNAGGFSLNATQQTSQQSPGFMDTAMNGLEKFQKGSQQSLPEAYKGWGNNAATYGFLAGKVQGMAGGGPRQAPNMTTNISYQQPENTYLKKRGY